jgi:hypothetical protein
MPGDCYQYEALRIHKDPTYESSTSLVNGQQAEQVAESADESINAVHQQRYGAAQS